MSGAAALMYLLCLAIYRVYLSPLSRIPGPKLAALTYWYETYYEVYKGGQYFRVIDDMHAKYGPVVRITPNELHFDDPEFNDVLYPSAGKRKIDRPEYAAARAGTPGSIVATAQHDVHRRRRNALNSFFSGASVRRLEPIIQEHMDKLLVRMQKSGAQCQVIKPYHIFKACASDIITLYAFGDSFHFMDRPDYGQPYFRAGEAFNSMTHIFGAFPWLLTLATTAPGWLVKYLKPEMTEFVDRREWWTQKVREIRNSNDPERAKNTIFGGILDSTLSAADKTDERLANEAQLVVFAGEGTTAYTLTSAIYHLLAKPEILQKVKDELAAVVGDGRQIPTFQELDRLRYLNAVINEVIRLHPGAMHRQIRVCPNDPIIYIDRARGVEHVVPPGTVYAISPLTSHMNGNVFKDPYEFIPERWIDHPEISKAFMGFSRGTRACVGITLARRELTATLATIFIKYDLYRGQQGPTLELYDTVRARDIDAAKDYITPLPAKGSLGLRVRIRN
ncbi:cytochrome P450 [Aspergillus caelatus]|uniref:Cytochrome P450 n=1 Tax=Aspergillus caelatus TaxID=61420 RepID=A0A5N7A7W2_9EURO|nr:cytochrome P450 [Aspergillus caelatus]KAE8365518.1 cytochrome P450 [Aspergillus caelatus]